MFIIRFRPGKAYPFLQLPCREIDNIVVEHDALLNQELADFREMLMAATTPEKKFAVAEGFLLRRMKNHFGIHPAISYIVESIIANSCTTTVSNIVQHTGYSHKHLLVLFAKYIGLSPKGFLRVMKFQQTIQQIERMQHVDWVQLAHDCGYFDQSHFINKFREFSGFSPVRYLEAKSTSEFVNYVPMR